MVTIHSPNITKIDTSVNLFLLIGLYMYIIPKIVTDPLWSSKNLREHIERIFIIENFGSISYKEKGQESLIGIFDTFVQKEEIVNVPRYHRRENYRGIKDGK